MSALDPASPLPLYHQLAARLRASIEAGEHPVGSRIPSEPELARTYGIGRPTVRQATDLLVRQRRLERRRGAGTFVVEPPRAVDLFSLAGTLTSFEHGGVAARSTLLQRPARRRVGPDPENPFSGGEAWHFRRLTRVEGEPVLLEDLWLDPARFPDLASQRLAGRSLARVVAEHYGLRPRSADQTFRVVPLDAERAEALGLPAAAPVLRVKRRLHFPDAPDAIHAELWCRTDRLVFSQTLTAPDVPGGGLAAPDVPGGGAGASTHA